MKRLRQKFIILLTLFIVIVGFGGWLILINFFPFHVFKDYPIIPIFFFMVGIVSINILTRLKIDRSNKLLNTFMMIRVVKMLLTLILSIIFLLMDRAEIRSYAIMIVAFYLCYLFLETYIYIQIETWNKKNYMRKQNDDDKKNKLIVVFALCLLFLPSHVSAQEKAGSSALNDTKQKELNIKELILEHLVDTYEWHITTINETSVTIPLPIILYSKTNGWNVFLSSKLQNKDAHYRQFYIATSGSHIGKIVEQNASGEEVRPLDISLTKNAASLLLSSFILIVIILSISRAYKKDSMVSEKGFRGAIEVVIISITDGVIKPSIGKTYKKYAPYILSLFFFILFNNLLGLVPIFPGGANVTGNISVTLVLAVFVFLIVNFTGTKTYYKELFWPDVPVWLKVPFPLMQIIEIVGTITKPFALMIRLFANITAGHSIVLGLTTVIFVTVSLGPAINGSMTFISVLFNIFILFLEILVAFIQAYIFTMLTSVFIGLARNPEVAVKKKQNQIKI